MTDTLDARQRLIDQLNACRPKEPVDQLEPRRFSDAATFLDHSMMAFQTLTTRSVDDMRKIRQDAKIASREKTKDIAFDDGSVWRSAEEQRYFLALNAEYDAVTAEL